MVQDGRSDDGSVDRERVETVAHILYEARVQREPLPPLPDNLVPTSAVEAELIDDRVAEIGGWPVLGWKIGCTSEHAQQLLGADGPFAGRVYSVLDDGAVLQPMDLVNEPNLEGELAFRISSTPPVAPADGPVDRAVVREGIAEVMPAIEFVGGRFHTFIGSPLTSVIADAGANVHLALGAPVTNADLDGLDQVEATMTVAGEETGRGTGADVLGHPLNALAWLVEHLGRRGISLEPGQVVTTGTATQVSPLPTGATATASMVGIGSVSVTRA